MNRNAVTPPDRLEKWPRHWGKPKPLTPEEADAFVDEFLEGFVPGHMQKKFWQFFGTPRAGFGNRFFYDDAVYHEWTRRFDQLGMEEETSIDATIVYANGDRLEGWRLKGIPRRTLKDLVLDDWHAACARVTGVESSLWVFVEPKMRGCVTRGIRSEEP